MVWTRGGYVIPRHDLDKYIGKRIGGQLGKWDALTPYTDEMKKAFDTLIKNDPAHKRLLPFDFDTIFTQVEVISLQRPNDVPEGAIYLVRSEGDPEKKDCNESHFVETTGDRWVKEALEASLGLKIEWSVRMLVPEE
jgi:hypothetical protein